MSTVRHLRNIPLALTSAAAVVLAQATSALALTTPQVTLPPSVQSAMDRVQPYIVFGFMALGLYTILNFFWQVMRAHTVTTQNGELASKKISFMDILTVPTRIMLIVLITVILLFNFVDIINALLSFVYSFAS